MKDKEKKIDVEFVSEKEALLRKNKEYAESDIKACKDKIFVNQLVVDKLEEEIKKLKNGNSK